MVHGPRHSGGAVRSSFASTAAARCGRSCGGNRSNLARASRRARRLASLSVPGSVLRTTAIGTAGDRDRRAGHWPMHFASHSCIGNCRDRRAPPGAAPPTLASTLVPALLRSPPSRRPALHGILADRSCAADRARRGRGPGGIGLADRQIRVTRKNTSVLQRTFPVSHAHAPPCVLSMMTARHRPAASGILPYRAPRTLPLKRRSG